MNSYMHSNSAERFWFNGIFDKFNADWTYTSWNCAQKCITNLCILLILSSCSPLYRERSICAYVMHYFRNFLCCFGTMLSSNERLSKIFPKHNSTMGFFEGKSAANAHADFSVWAALCKTLMDTAATAMTLELHNWNLHCQQTRELWFSN